MSDERVIPPSARRLQAARAEGRFPRSREVAAGVLILLALSILSMSGANWFTASMDTLRESLTAEPMLAPTLEHVQGWGKQWLLRLCWKLLPILCFSMAAVWSLQLIQGGPVWLPQRLLPQASSFGWSSHSARSFRRGIVRAVMGTAGFMLCLSVLVITLWFTKVELFQSSGLELDVGLAATAARLTHLAILVVLLTTVMVSLDYVYRVWSYFQSLKMTIEESRDEARGRHSMSVAPAASGSHGPRNPSPPTTRSSADVSLNGRHEHE